MNGSPFAMVDDKKKQTEIKTYGAKIAGWGRGLPARAVTNFDLEKIFDTSDEWISQRTGIKERRIVDPEKGETAVSLGAESAKQAIEHAKANGLSISVEDIDLIICATATGDNLFPSTACLIQSEIGATNAAAFDLSAACTGFIFGINSARSFINNGSYKNVLVIGVDLRGRRINK